jgi:hypothetical protein
MGRGWGRLDVSGSMRFWFWLGRRTTASTSTTAKGPSHWKFAYTQAVEEFKEALGHVNGAIGATHTLVDDRSVSAVRSASSTDIDCVAAMGTT